MKPKPPPDSYYYCDDQPETIETPDVFEQGDIAWKERPL